MALRKTKAILLALGLTIGAYAASPAIAGAAPGAVEGEVVDAGTKAPIANIEVCAIGAKTEAQVGECALTGANGRYALEGVPAGVYVVEFWPAASLNYLIQFYEGKARFGEADPVFVSGGSTVTGIDAEMIPGAVVSGVVTDASNHAPLQNVEVCVGSVGEGAFRCVITNSTGEYTVGRLPSDDYKVSFWAEEVSFDYVFQYYDHKSTWADADEISLATGDSISGIDAAMQRRARITGTLTDSSGGFPEEVLVCAQTLLGVYVDCTWSGSSGRYELYRLAPGDYKVVFSPEIEEEPADRYATRYYNEQTSFGLANPVALSEGQTAQNIDAKLERILKPTPPATPSGNSPKAPSRRTAHKPRRCKKGFRKRVVKGKTRCVRRAKHRHAHRPNAR
jgi:Carboxypeptidase regulatory-like domain